MNNWSNIEISAQDPEIMKINALEGRLGDLPAGISKIRELITRFEVCHFKYKRHLENIKQSIAELNPKIDTTRIGINHIQHGNKVLENDTSGKSIVGQQYVWALRAWLNDKEDFGSQDKYDHKLIQKIQVWLGSKNPDKVRLVMLLLARLIWDWTSFENLQQDDDHKTLESQASRMDICHYAFPKNLDLLIKGIGQLKPVQENSFEGCGSFNSEIKKYLEEQFEALKSTIESYEPEDELEKDELTRKWLILCLAKTIKENLKIPDPLFKH